MIYKIYIIACICAHQKSQLVSHTLSSPPTTNTARRESTRQETMALVEWMFNASLNYLLLKVYLTEFQIKLLLAVMLVWTKGTGGAMSNEERDEMRIHWVQHPSPFVIDGESIMEGDSNIPLSALSVVLSQNVFTSRLRLMTWLVSSIVQCWLLNCHYSLLI